MLEGMGTSRVWVRVGVKIPTGYPCPTLPSDILQETPVQVPEGTMAPSRNKTINPACLRVLYNTSSYVPISMNANKLAIAGYLDQFVIMLIFR